jgi:hypothetical protein
VSAEDAVAATPLASPPLPPEVLLLRSLRSRLTSSTAASGVAFESMSTFMARPVTTASRSVKSTSLDWVVLGLLGLFRRTWNSISGNHACTSASSRSTVVR